MNDTQRTILQLSRLQYMLNEVLEQTGRLFVDASKGNTGSATAHGIRLKQIVPGATRGFHEALDELESELFVAKAVMRRDLVNFRNQQSAQTNGVEPEKAVETAEDKADVDMVDAGDAATEEPSGKETAPENVMLEEASPKEPSTTKLDNEMEEETKPTPRASGEPAASSDLHIDTDQPNQQSAANASATDPGTAGTQNIDFDSLFNDSDNAATNDDSKSQTPKAIEDSQPTGTGEDQNTSQQEPDFSFESLNAQNPSDNDGKQEDISSLLPGLESYANAEENDLQMGDFSANESQQQQQQKAGGAQDQSQQQDQAQNQGSGLEQEGEQRDTTFDDIMNFGDFDLGALGSGDNNFGEGDDSRFDDNFFNVE